MIKKTSIFLSVIVSPFLFMIFINEFTNVPGKTNNHINEYCTWHCHNVTCKHYKKSYLENPSKLKKLHKNVFDWYVNSLHNNSLGLNYRIINLLVFLIGYPAIGSLLVWKLISKSK